MFTQKKTRSTKDIDGSHRLVQNQPLSSADERVNAIYVYDLDIPEELTSLEAVIAQDDLPMLDLNEKSLSSIKALLIEMGNDIGQLHRQFLFAGNFVLQTLQEQGLESSFCIGFNIQLEGAGTLCILDQRIHANADIGLIVIVGLQGRCQFLGGHFIPLT